MTPDTDIEAAEKILLGKWEDWKFTVFDLMILGIWSENGRIKRGNLESCIHWIELHPEKVIDL